MQCLLLKICFVAVSGYLPLSTMSYGTKEGFRGLSSCCFEQPSPLCSWSLFLMAAPVYVDLLLKHCAPDDMEFIAPFQWEVLARRAEFLRSAVKLLVPPMSSPALAITRQLCHCIGLTRRFIYNKSPNTPSSISAQNW